MSLHEMRDCPWRCLRVGKLNTVLVIISLLVYVQRRYIPSINVSLAAVVDCKILLPLHAVSGIDLT